MPDIETAVLHAVEAKTAEAIRLIVQRVADDGTLIIGVDQMISAHLALGRAIRKYEQMTAHIINDSPYPDDRSYETTFGRKYNGR